MGARLLLALGLLCGLLVASCGDEPAPTAMTPAVPAWAKVAPEQIAEAEKHGLPLSQGVVRYTGTPDATDAQTLPSVFMTLTDSGAAAVALHHAGSADTLRAAGNWRIWNGALLLEVLGAEEARPVTYFVMCSKQEVIFFNMPYPGIGLSGRELRLALGKVGPYPGIQVHLRLVADLPAPGEGAR